MKRERIGQLVFLVAALLAGGLYWITAPSGLPWNDSTYWALAYLDETYHSTAMPYAAWGRAVQVAGGSIVLSCLMASVASGLLGALVNRYFGWRAAIASALVWMFLPGVWNGAILGLRGVVGASFVVVALWAANPIVLWALVKMKELKGAGVRNKMEGVHTRQTVLQTRANRIAGWTLLALAFVFALVSLSLHDYRLGESASVYARGVVEDAGERIVVMNGILDQQIENEVKVRGEGGQWKVLSLIKDDEYREDVLKWVRTEWPGETNLAVAAQVSVSAFADEAIKVHPERFYVMDGRNTTLAQWERRWAAFEPYLKSSDGFVPVARRLFAREGNAVGNRLQETDAAAAWKLYGRIANEIDRNNISALVNMGEMLRKGLYTTTEQEKKDIKARIDAFLAKDRNRAHAREIVRMMGPVKEDPELEAKMREARQAQFEAMKASGQKLEFSPAYKRMKQGSDAMIDAFVAGDLEGAGAIARRILSDPQWAGWAPANAVMGVVCASKGEYVAAEKFFITATTGTDIRPDIIMNNYADTLMHLGKLDEAEVILREGIARTGERFFIYRFTLAEVLTQKAKGVKDEKQFAAIQKEVAGLVLSVMKNAPPEVQRLVRAKQKSGEILK